MKRVRHQPNPVFPAGGKRERLLKRMWVKWAHWQHILMLLNAIPEGSRPVSATVMRATATRWGLKRPFGRGRFSRDRKAEELGIKL